jgi:GT2 family glycosyltransferase
LFPDGFYATLRCRYADRRITWLRQNNAGQSAARNYGARAGHGMYLAFIDQDDCWYPGWLETALAALATGPASFVYCDVDRMDEAGRVTQQAFFGTSGRGTHPKQNLTDVIGQDCWVMPSAMFMRRARFLALGGFDESLAGCEDDDLFRRFFCADRCRFIPTPLVRWRQTATSASHLPRMDASRLRYWEILEATYSDGRAGSRRLLRHVIAPRFLRLFAGVYRQAAAARDLQRLTIARTGLLSVRPHLPGHLRLSLAVLLFMPMPLFTVWQDAAFNSHLYHRVMRVLGVR